MLAADLSRWRGLSPNCPFLVPEPNKYLVILVIVVTTQAVDSTRNTANPLMTKEVTKQPGKD